MANKGGKLAAVVGGAVGAIGGYLIMKKMSDKHEATPQKPRTAFDKLVENQLVCDALDGATLAGWFKKQQERFGAELVFFIAKPTAETAKMFALDRVPEQLDREHSLLQVAVNKENYEVKAIRMISYNTVNEKIAKLLENDDYVIINGGAVNE